MSANFSNLLITSNVLKVSGHKSMNFLMQTVSNKRLSISYLHNKRIFKMMISELINFKTFRNSCKYQFWSLSNHDNSLSQFLQTWLTRSLKNLTFNKYLKSLPKIMFQILTSLGSKKERCWRFKSKDLKRI